MAYTIVLTNELGLRVQAAAAAEGVTTEQFVARVLSAQVNKNEADAKTDSTVDSDKPWMRFVGISRQYADEIHRIDQLIEEEFEVIEEEETA